MAYICISSMLLIAVYIIVFLYHICILPLDDIKVAIIFAISFINTLLCMIFAMPKVYYVAEYKQEYINTSDIYQITYYLYRNNQFYIHYVIEEDASKSLNIGDSVLLYNTDVQVIYYLGEDE